MLPGQKYQFKVGGLDRYIVSYYEYPAVCVSHCTPVTNRGIIQGCPGFKVVIIGITKLSNEDRNEHFSTLYLNCLDGQLARQEKIEKE